MNADRGTAFSDSFGERPNSCSICHGNGDRILFVVADKQMRPRTGGVHTDIFATVRFRVTRHHSWVLRFVISKVEQTLIFALAILVVGVVVAHAVGVAQRGVGQRIGAGASG